MNKIEFPVMFEVQNSDNTTEIKNNFTKVKIYLMHVGENLNNTIFEKEVIDAAIPTLPYIPIVGYEERNSDDELDFSNHRYITVPDYSGKKLKYKLKYQGIPYGVVLSSHDNNIHYEDKVCSDGVTRTYLVVDGLLWNLFENGKDIFDRDEVKNQSMEIWDDETLDFEETEDGKFKVKNFTFRSSCILGKDFKPAMIDSTISTKFSYKDRNENFEKDLNNYINAIYNYEKVEVLNEGGVLMAKKQAEEVIENKVENTKEIEEKLDCENEVTTTETEKEKVEDTKVETEEEKIDYSELIKSKDDEINQLNTLVKEYQEKIKAYSELEKEYEKLKLDKEEREKQIEYEKKNELLNKYEQSLQGNESFENLKAEIEKYTYEELNSKCALIYAEINLFKKEKAKTNFSNDEVSLAIDDEAKNPNIIETKYGNILIKQ